MKTYENFLTDIFKKKNPQYKVGDYIKINWSSEFFPSYLNEGKIVELRNFPVLPGELVRGDKYLVEFVNDEQQVV